MTHYKKGFKFQIYSVPISSFRLNFNDREDFGFASSFFVADAAVESCGNLITDFGQYKSGRVMGPSDFYSEALSIYEGISFAAFAGREVVITSTAMTDFEFIPRAAASFGNSSWTFFSEVNFGGSSTCFQAPNNSLGFHNKVLDLEPVKSVIKGCNLGDVNHFLDL